jgi:hypothetical protein
MNVSRHSMHLSHSVQLVDSERHGTTIEREDSSLQASRLEYKRSWINEIFFPHLPDLYPLSKKLHIVKNNSRYGDIYVFFQDLFSVILCITFIISSTSNSYTAVQTVFVVESILIFFIFFDTTMSCFISRTYLRSYDFILDVVTIFPTFFILLFVLLVRWHRTFYEHEIMSMLRLVRVLRLFRTLHIFKSRLKRIVFKLCLTFASLTFVAAGLLQLFENTLPQVDLECQHINADTEWQPSCSEVTPASEMTYCDCLDNNCQYLYDVSDYCAFNCDRDYACDNACVSACA